VLAELAASVSAAIGDDGPQGPAFLDVPIDVLRAPVPASAIDPAMFQPIVRRPMPPSRQAAGEAAALLRASKRPLVISGRGTIGCAEALDRFLTAAGTLHLETKENRGVLPADHPAHVTALRGRSTAECDLVVTVGRSLDYELAYGSRAMFRNAPRFLRIGRNDDELRDNRPGDVELRADVGPALDAMSDLQLRGADRDWDWSRALRVEHCQRVQRLAEGMGSAGPGGDGLMHPFRLIAELNQHLDDDAIVAVDGGDIFSFARVGLRRGRCLGAGSLGCLGVAAPFAVSASLVAPHRRVVCLSGDGAFGFNALEISTAVRHGSRAVFVVANNAAWNIERLDQELNFGGNVFGTELPDCRYDLLGAALGAHPEHVVEPADLHDAFDRAFANPPAVIDVSITRDALSPDFRSGLAELPDHQPLRSWEDAHLAIAASEGE
jgi:acetolactate synthase-1/2/3 large subunit